MPCILTYYEEQRSMKKEEKTCPICGKKENEKLPFIQGICIECFIKTKITDIPIIEIPVCPYCGKIRLKGKWKHVDQQYLTNHIIGEAEKWLRKTFSRYGIDVYTQIINEQIQAILSSGTSTYVWQTPIEVKYTTMPCPDCSRKITGYHEATIQFRGIKRKLTEKQKEAIYQSLSTLPANLRENIVEIKDVREGIDAKIYDQATAKMIANHFAETALSEIKTSYKTISIKNGVKKTRLTISVRLGDYKTKQIMTYKNKPAVIQGIRGNKVKIHVIPEKRSYSLTLQEAQTMLKPYKENTLEVIITAIAPDKVYVMKTTDYDTEIIPPENIWGIPEEGKTAILLFHNNKYYLVIP